MVEAIDPEDWRIGVQRSIDRGHIKVANNFKDIALQLDLNPEVVLKAVDNWNKMCEDGVDPEFNYRQLWLKPIKKAPFYGIKVGTQLLATHCGLMVDEKMQVYSTQGAPIPGLYTASMAAGGICGISNNGWAGISPLGELFLSFATGYIAAQTICGELED
jgi:fumarate reductase flavoprotein subunit